jgi:hypothetical protein
MYQLHYYALNIIISLFIVALCYESYKAHKNLKTFLNKSDTTNV